MESANRYLARCSKEAATSELRELAKLTLEEYTLFVQQNKLRKVKTRRSFWDLLSGMQQIGPNGYVFFNDFTPLRSGDMIFLFPIFEEACLRYGRTPPGYVTSFGIKPKSHRNPQTTKWGNEQLKSPPREGECRGKNIKFSGSAFEEVEPNHYRVKTINHSFHSKLSFERFVRYAATVNGQIAVLKSLKRLRDPKKVQHLLSFSKTG